jgi:hypothetical protein
MASAGTKCPVCGKTVAVGLVSGTLIQHEDKLGQRCAGSGQQPAAPAVRKTPSPRTSSAGGSATRGSAKRTSPATKGGVTVRRVEVDPEVARERAERAERLRTERAEAARARNEVNVSYFDEPGV